MEWLQTSWLLIAQLNSTINQYSYDQLTPSFRYQFRLRGENRLGISAWSPLVWVRMQGYLNNTGKFAIQQISYYGVAEENRIFMVYC